MSEEITELKIERQYVLKEINEKLSQILTELKELNELAASGGGFFKDLEEANQYIAYLQQKFVPEESNVSPSQQNATQQKKKKSSTIEIIEEPMESSLMQTVQDSMNLSE